MEIFSEALRCSLIKQAGLGRGRARAATVDFIFCFDWHNATRKSHHTHRDGNAKSDSFQKTEYRAVAPIGRTRHFTPSCAACFNER